MRSRSCRRPRAADLPTAPSTYPALGPGAADVALDYWSGLSVGAGISVWGGKGVKGGVGGETDLSYEHVFDNGIMLGVQASTGYMPLSPNERRIHPSSPAALSPAARRSSRATISAR